MAAEPEQSAALPRHVHVEAIQSITPMKVTEPGRARGVATTAGPLSRDLLASHLRVVLYYGRPSEDESGWTAAGWLKESLNVALSEQPLLAGRLRWRDDGEGLELRFNDAGVRLVEARADVSMAEFLGSEGRELREAHLAYWVDPDEKNPQFSALFYVQVTSFQGDGYSVGISCSLLLSDPLFTSMFLQRWAQIHSEMKAEDQFTKVPIFHLGSFKSAGRTAHFPSIPLDSPISHTHRTILFELPAGVSEGQALAATAAAACVEAAANWTGGKAAPEFSLIAAGADRLKELKVDESCVNQGKHNCSGSLKGSPQEAGGDWLCNEGLAIGEGNEPVQVSCYIDSAVSRALVLVMPPLEQGGAGLISVTLPIV